MIDGSVLMCAANVMVLYHISEYLSS